jgi:hypothetical protein
MEFHADEHLFRTMPPANSYRHESFIIPNYSIIGMSYKCELCCEEGVMPEYELNNHCVRNPHVSRVNQIRQMQQNQSVAQCAALQPRIEKLGLRAWQYEAESKLYWTLLNNNADGARAAQWMAEAIAVIQKYEEMERISLLELAIWNAVCIGNPDNTMAKDDYHSWQDWFREGWKCNKSAMRKANAIAVIISAVLPFLDA